MQCSLGLFCLLFFLACVRVLYDRMHVYVDLVLFSG